MKEPLWTKFQAVFHIYKDFLEVDYVKHWTFGEPVFFHEYLWKFSKVNVLNGNEYAVTRKYQHIKFYKKPWFLIG